MSDSEFREEDFNQSQPIDESNHFQSEQQSPLQSSFQNLSLSCFQSHPQSSFQSSFQNPLQESVEHFSVQARLESDIYSESQNQQSFTQRFAQRFHLFSSFEHFSSGFNNELKKANKQALNSFPLMSWSVNHLKINEGEKCSFCLEEYKINDQLRSIPCMHRFHSQCIDEWLLVKKICPLCKFNISNY